MKKLILFLLFIFPAASILAHGDWQTARRDSAHIAPSPAAERGAVIQAFAARVWGWRGVFADHTWITVKPQNAESYTVYEVIGWRLWRGLSVVRIANDIPDRHWFGGKPRLLLDLRGKKAQALVDDIARAAKQYPFAEEYHAFPGPNSNTFTAWIARQVPQLGLQLPLRAVGKGYINRIKDKDIS